MDKAEFLKSKFTPSLAALSPAQKGNWGKMNAQQMVEHMSEYVRIANGKHVVSPVNTPEITQKAYAFMMSEKPFRENTPNVLLPDEPAPVKQASMKDAIAELQSEIDDFFRIYSQTPGLRVTSPFFGELNFEEQVHLLHKHAVHHSRQFGLIA